MSAPETDALWGCQCLACGEDLTEQNPPDPDQPDLCLGCGHLLERAS